MPKYVRRFVLFAGATLCLLVQSVSSACAHPTSPNAPYVVSAEDEWGNNLRAFHQGNETFLLGTYGRRYNLRVQNQTGRRVEAVVTVDGRDVVSGHVGDFVHERGYLIDPYGSVLIDGFRTSLDEVAAFRFSTPGESYSSRMGTPQNVGVIGVAFFPERPAPVVRRPLRRREPMEEQEPRRESRSDARSSSGDGASGLGTASARPASPAKSASEAKGSAGARDDYEYDAPAAAEAAPAPRANNLGTEYGEGHESHVQEVGFSRADSLHPSQVIVLRYDDEQGLLARGIQLRRPPVASYAPPRPNPFPYNRFAPPPP